MINPYSRGGAAYKLCMLAHLGGILPRVVDFFLKIVFLLFLIFSQSWYDANAGPLKEKRKYTLQRLTGDEPDIDGSLTDECWIHQGEWSTNFRQFLPKNDAEPTRQTEFKLLYDDNNLYAAFRCFDDPDSIVIISSRRDNMSGDIIGIAFDSHHDLRTAYEFDLTSAGSKTDLSMIDKNFLFNWDAVWEGKVAFEDSAWTAEMKIPLSQLRFPDKPEHVWGLHVWRWIYRNKEEDQWNVFPIDAPSWPDNFGELHGISNLKKQRRIELLPYGTMSYNKYPLEPGNPFVDGTDFIPNAGVDGKIGLSSNFTIDFTINPDFGQVEADPSVLNLTAFETFYDEKRPFFLEGKSIFDFTINGDQLFYSRRIGHRPLYYPELTDNEFADIPRETTILNALKLTGKTQSGLSIGVIQSITSREYAEVDRSGRRSQITVEPWSNYFLSRIRQDFNQGNSSLGAMFTSTQRFIDAKDTHLYNLPLNSFTGGLDFRHSWENRSYFVDAKALFSHINGKQQAITSLQTNSRHYYQRPDITHVTLLPTRKSLSGYGGSFHAGKRSGGHWYYSGQLVWYSPGLDLNDLGYLQMADVVNQKAEISYNENIPKSFYRSYHIQIGQQSEWDFGGRLLRTNYNFNAKMIAMDNWIYYLSVDRVPRWLHTRTLRGGPALNLEGYWSGSIYLQTDSRRDLYYSLNGKYRQMDDGKSHFFDLAPSVVWRPSTRFNLSSTFSFMQNIDDAQYITTVSLDDSPRYIVGRINQQTWNITLRLEYSFTPDLILQYYVSPFISTGSYSDIKYVKNAAADSYEDRYHTFNDRSARENTNNHTLELDENEDGIPDYSTPNPDFSFSEMRSNFVLRWEYKPGSTFYFVWTNSRSESMSQSARTLSYYANRLLSLEQENVFMLKFNYWFSL